MKEKLIEHMNRIVTLTEEERGALGSILKVRGVDRLGFVFQAGSVCKENYFISRGLFRVFQLSRGVEKTESFFAEQSWYTDFESYRTGQPTQDNFQALEEGEVIYFEKDEIEALYGKDSRLEKIGRYYAEQAAVCIKNKNELLTLRSPEERYRLLAAQSPHLLQRIPQYYLASYLNVQPESLSRIRKRIATG